MGLWKPWLGNKRLNDHNVWTNKSQRTLKLKCLIMFTVYDITTVTVAIIQADATTIAHMLIILCL